jgi:hypothetical protein
MRTLLRTLLVTTALGAMPVMDAQAQDVQDTLGRVLQGLQGGQDQRPAPEGYRDGGRRDDERDTGRRGMQDGDDRRRSTGEAERRLDEQQRRLDEERRRLDRDRR